MLTAESHRPSSRGMTPSTRRLSENFVKFRANNALKKRMERAAKAKGLSLSDWVRGAALMRLEAEQADPR